MKICSTIENISDEYGGPAVSLPSLLSTLKCENSYSGVIISGQKHKTIEPDNSIVKSKSLDWEPYLINGPSKICYSFEAESLFEKHFSDSDVIFLNNLWNHNSYLTGKVAFKLDVPLITSIRGTLYPWSLSQGKLRKKLSWSLFQKEHLNRSAFIHVTCEQEKKAVKSLGIESPVVICPHGVDIPDISIDFSLAKVINSYGLPSGKKYFLFMSRLHVKKGLDILLSVWERIARKNPDWCLLVVGPDYGNYKRKINEIINRSNLSKQLVLIGMVKGKNKDDIFMLSDFFVLPTYSENFGVVIAEAMSFGLPVITTTGTPWCELNDNNLGSCITLSESNLELELNEYFQMPSKSLKSMGVRARKFVEDNYSWKKQAKIFAHNVKKYC